MAEKKNTKKANAAADDPIMNLRFMICPRHDSEPPEGDPKIVEFRIPARLDFRKTAIASVSHIPPGISEQIKLTTSCSNSRHRSCHFSGTPLEQM